VADSIGVLSVLIFNLFVLGGRQVTECFVESLLVVEADPVEREVYGLDAQSGRVPARLPE
jgi:hypothetical protein